MALGVNNTKGIIKQIKNKKKQEIRLTDTAGETFPLPTRPSTARKKNIEVGHCQASATIIPIIIYRAFNSLGIWTHSEIITRSRFRRRVTRIDGCSARSGSRISDFWKKQRPLWPANKVVILDGRLRVFVGSCLSSACRYKQTEHTHNNFSFLFVYSGYVPLRLFPWMPSRRERERGWVPKKILKWKRRAW